MQSDWIPSSSPGFIGAAIGMLLGVCLFGYGMWSFFAPEPPPMPQSSALVITGFVQWIACFFTMRKNRAAWAFALSLGGTGALLFLFGAPKLARAFDINLGLGFLPCVAFLAVTMLLIFAADEFERS